MCQKLQCYILFYPTLVVHNYTVRKSLEMNKNFADSENCVMKQDLE